MPWFKVDDGFWSHPKTATLSDAAVTLWVRAGAYSCQHLTDGVIRRPVLRLVGTAEAAVELVEANLWVEAADGWRFHDWDHYQPTKADVEAERAAARERMRERRRNKQGRFAGSSAEHPANVREKFGDGSSTPTRPDPSRPDPPSTTPNGVLEGAALSPFCKKHPTGTEDSCGPCGTARKRYDNAVKEQKSKPSPQPFTAGATCPNGEHSWLGDGTCTRCTERRHE